jgi:serpin B
MRVHWNVILLAGFLARCGDGSTGGEGPDELPGPTFARSALSRIEDPAPDTGTLARVVEGNTDFAFDLYQRLRPSTDNVLFSPLSLSMAMAMMWGGARTQTETEIATVFHFTEGQAATHTAMNALDQELTEASEELTVTISNALWAAPSLNPLGGVPRPFGAKLRSRSRPGRLCGP